MASKEALSEMVRAAPQEAGVYSFIGEEGVCLYIGKALHLRSRLQGHLNNPSTSGGQQLLDETVELDWTIMPSETDALILEAQRIRAQTPRYNRALRYGDRYPSIIIHWDEDYPRVRLGYEVPCKGREQLGPLPSGWALEALELASWALGLRTCKGSTPGAPSIPCLDGHIGRCSGPCVGWIDKAEYRKNVHHLVQSLSGKRDWVSQEMKARMKESSLERSYAKAKVWRDRLQLWEELNKSRPLAQLQLPSQADLIGWARVEDEIMLWTARVVDHRIIREEQVYWMGENVDEAILHWLAIRSPRPEQVVIGPESGTDLGRLGLAQYTSVAIEKWLARSALLALRKRRASEALASRTLNPKAGLLELQEKLEMSSYPHRIECFDISNLGSQATVASMSVMLEGEAAASQTRRFKIQSASQDDYGSLNEALSRRVKRWETQSKGFQSRPDILLIDGGVGQARAVMEAVKPWLELGTQLWGLAKEEEVLHHPSGQTVQLGPTSHGRRLLQQIRDQTHHRAVSYHRLLREKAAWG